MGQTLAKSRQSLRNKLAEKVTKISHESELKVHREAAAQAENGRISMTRYTASASAAETSAGTQFTRGQDINTIQSLSKNKKEEPKNLEMKPDLLQFLQDAGPLQATMNKKLSSRDRPRAASNIGAETLPGETITGAQDQSSTGTATTPTKPSLRQKKKEIVLLEVEVQALMQELSAATSIDERATIAERYDLASKIVEHLAHDIAAPRISRFSREENVIVQGFYGREDEDDADIRSIDELRQRRQALKGE